MDAPENTVEAREQSMRSQLDGLSGAATAAEAEAGRAAAREDLASGRGAGYGIGFGFVKSFGSPRGLDGLRLEFAVTDGKRVANVHAVVSGTQLSMLGRDRVGSEPDEQIVGWMLDRLYERVALLPRSVDRYATLLGDSHPLYL